MILKYKKPYAEGEFDTETIELIALPARPIKYERHPILCITEGKYSMNYQIGELDFGSLEDENAMAKEIERRWNLVKDQEQREPDGCVPIPCDTIKEIMQHPELVKEIMEQTIREGIERQKQEYLELLDQISKPCGDGFFNLIKGGGE